MWIARRAKAITREVHCARHDGEAGFTLVEVIAAFAILAFAFSILLGVISDGIWRAAQAEIEAEAGTLAASLLAEAGTEAVVTSGERVGQNRDALRWRLRTEPYGGGDESQGPIGAYRVTAEVFWRNGVRERSVSLSTLRLGPREPTR
jgi:general secretion pathway protein I